MGDGRPFHFRTVSLELGDQALFHFFAGDELVAADYPAIHDMNVRIDFFTGFFRQSHHSFVCGEFPKAHLGHFAGLVAKDGGVHVVVEGIL